MVWKKVIQSKWKLFVPFLFILIGIGIFVTHNAKQACDSQLDKVLKSWEEAGFSGSIAITKDGKFECLEGYGLANKDTNIQNSGDTVFSLGSVSKAFTAAAVFKLVDEKKLSLNTRAGEILPELSGPIANVTIEQLLLHTSGLKGSHGTDHKSLSQEEAIKAISDLDQAFKPGSDYLYSNAGYTLLALIIEKSSGMSYRTYMTSHILTLPGGDVLGGFWDGKPAAPSPRAVGYLADGKTGLLGNFNGPHWAVDGNGDIAMSMRNLARWTFALFNGQLLSKNSTEAVTRSGFNHGNGTSETPGWVAYDPSNYGEPGFAAAGGGGDVGHNVIVAWLPKSKRVIAVASNNANIKAEELLQTIAPALISGDPLPTPPPHVNKIDRKALTNAVGTYALPTGGTLHVSVQGFGLAVSAHGADAIAALFPLPKDIQVKDIQKHEKDLLQLLNGETQEGKKERKFFESNIGPIDSIKIEKTIVKDGSLRTYVTIMSKNKSILLWYSLNDKGGVAAAEASTKNPTLLLVPVGNNHYRPADPTGNNPDIDIAFKNEAIILPGVNGILLKDK